MNPILRTFREWSDITPDDVEALRSELYAFLYDGEPASDLIREALDTFSGGGIRKWETGSQAHLENALDVLERWQEVFGA